MRKRVVFSVFQKKDLLQSQLFLADTTVHLDLGKDEEPELDGMLLWKLAAEEAAEEAFLVVLELPLKIEVLGVEKVTQVAAAAVDFQREY